jgi:hypothetical protein
MNLMNHFPYRLNLQFFAAEGEGGGQPGDQQPVNQAGGEQNPQDGGQNQQQEKMLPQSEVNNLIAKEKKKATEKILRDLGIDDFENAKEGLKKFKEWQESQKSEAQKLSDRLQALEKEKGSLSEENERLKAQLSALKAGVKADSVEDVVVLARNYLSDDVDMDQAIQKVLEKYPHFKTQQQQDEQQPQKPMFSTGQHQKDGKLDDFAAALLGQK